MLWTYTDLNRFISGEEFLFSVTFDEDLIKYIVHIYFKYLKYGFGRATDIANNQIRRGRLTMADAKAIVERHDGNYPHSCLGKPLNEILEEIDMDESEFDKICDSFTNKRIFETDENGEFKRGPKKKLILKKKNFE